MPPASDTSAAISALSTLAGGVSAADGGGAGVAADASSRSGWRAGGAAGVGGENVRGGAKCGVVVANSSWCWRRRIQISQIATAAHVSQKIRLNSIGSTWHRQSENCVMAMRLSYHREE